ncbi:unnamed protein product [Scytosiphon promiscuus]
MRVEFWYYIWCSEREIDKRAATNHHLGFIISGLKNDVADGLRKIDVGEGKNKRLLADFVMTIRGSEKRLERKKSEIQYLEHVNIRQQNELERLRAELELRGLHEGGQRSAKTLESEDPHSASGESDEHTTRPPTPSTGNSHSRCSSLDSLPNDPAPETSGSEKDAILATATLPETAGTLAPELDSTATISATTADSDVVVDVIAHKGRVEESAEAAAESKGLEWHAGEKWTEGTIQDLFMANMTGISGSDEKATLMKHIMDIVRDHAERLTVHKVLGRGSCGMVQEVEFSDFPGESFALKTVNLGADKYVKQSALLEMIVFARLVQEPHDNVIAALAVDDTSTSMPVLLPKARCNLATLLDDDTLSIGDKLGLVLDVVRAAQHLHAMNIVHRDITPGNILVFDSEELGLHCKLADFGLSREIGEDCPAMSGTPGYMAYECMSAEGVTGAAGQDVVAIAMVLLTVCLRKEHRSPNLFATPALIKPEEFARLKDMVHRMTTLGEDVSLQRELFQVELTKRTMGDGSFMEMMLSTDKMDPAFKCPNMLTESLPAFLATNPDDREDMGSLLALVERLLKINTSS